jgi:tetratricopeptide (TPR) repeat protein
VREYRRALELNPNFGTAYGLLGWALALDGRSDEAIDSLEQAIRMSPCDPLVASYYCGLSIAHYFARRYEEAVEWGIKSNRKRPGLMGAYRILCASLAQAGRIEEARETVARLRAIQPNISIAWCEAHVPYPPRTMPHFPEGLRLAGIE